MNPNSLKALGGDGRDIPKPDNIKLIPLITYFLEQLDARDAAMVALDSSAAHHPALEHLLETNSITLDQYNIIAKEIAESQLETTLPHTNVLDMIFSRMSLERLHIYDAIGWNTYGDDEGEGMDVTI